MVDLPQQRQHPVRPGSSKEANLLAWVEAAVLRINRRHAKKFSGMQTDPARERGREAAENDSDGENVPGYESFGEVAADIERVLDVLWVSNTPSIQVPYMITLAGLVDSYLRDFSWQARCTFALLDKLDAMLAALLTADEGEGGQKRSRFPSCKSAKIMTDPITGLSRGYGFVRFSDETDQQRALSEMQGVYCGNRPMRISTATPKNKGPAGPGGPAHMGVPGGPPGGMYPPSMGGAGGPPGPGGPQMGYYGAAPQPMNQFTDPNNTTVFVGGLSGYVTEDELRSFFQGFGEITYVKIPPGKGCGFVQFVQRHAAEMAINQMQGYPIGNSRVRLSWGRSQNNSGPAGTPYRPAPPPPLYPAMGMPPAHQYGAGFAPMK
ncbi:uncharacterized protein TERG_12361 [Trichophyton rubrum CBS 118892]|uniref:RRM domain-containing protein n=1 Tax=Trichophyton rubrum (strain ATCC MYA-4607 / CBS 118892) TaxID=559305 RepID=A0A080WHT8_TRIRC|nr:uncharacterized protein TERG_12361 [Trichophyton rubrum CBS 118892]KFL62161.1 hypothetical protein TERG_12361 [Trichophyton rubrum CBS 118892]